MQLMPFIIGTVKGSNGQVVFIRGDDPIFEKIKVTTQTVSMKSTVSASLKIDEETIILEDVVQDIGRTDVESMGALSLSAYMLSKKDLGPSSDSEGEPKKDESEELKKLREQLEKSQAEIARLKEERPLKKATIDGNFVGYLEEEMFGEYVLVHPKPQNEQWKIAVIMGKTSEGKILFNWKDEPLYVDPEEFKYWWGKSGEIFRDLLRHWMDKNWIQVIETTQRFTGAESEIITTILGFDQIRDETLREIRDWFRLWNKLRDMKKISFGDLKVIAKMILILHRPIKIDDDDDDSYEYSEEYSYSDGSSSDDDSDDYREYQSTRSFANLFTEQMHGFTEEEIAWVKFFCNVRDDLSESLASAFIKCFIREEYHISPKWGKI